MEEYIFYLIGNIRDPERNQTLAELNVVSESRIRVSQIQEPALTLVSIELLPTNNRCHLLQQIGLSIQYRLQAYEVLTPDTKLHLFCTKGSHVDELHINRLINDKERIQGALEREDILNLMHTLCDHETGN